MSAKSNFGAVVSNDDMTITAPLGVGLAKTGRLGEAPEYGGKTELNYSNGWSSNTQVSQGATTTRTSNVTLTGRWEAATPPSRPTPPPDSAGYPPTPASPFVQSDTADHVRPAPGPQRRPGRLPDDAQPRHPPRLEHHPLPHQPPLHQAGHTRRPGRLRPHRHGQHPAAASPTRPSRTPPTPARPPRPSSATTAPARPTPSRPASSASPAAPGLLRVGLHRDPRPRPHRRQAARVLQGDDGRPQSPWTRTGAGDSAAGRAALKGASRRNLVNTYVWTAAGGLFAETTSTTDQVTEVTGRHLHRQRQPHLRRERGVRRLWRGIRRAASTSPWAAATASPAPRPCRPRRPSAWTSPASPDASLQQMTATGGHPRARRRRPAGPGARPRRRLPLHELLPRHLRRQLRGLLRQGRRPRMAGDAAPTPTPTASGRPARPTAKPPCWRILHRVTFVSRVRPVPAPADPPSLTAVMRAQNIASDNALASQLAPYLGTPAPASFADLTTTVTTAITAHFPAYAPYTADIINILAGFYSITSTSLPAITTPATSAPSSTLTTDTPTLATGTSLTLKYSTAPATVSAKNWVGRLPVGKSPGQQPGYCLAVRPRRGRHGHAGHQRHTRTGTLHGLVPQQRRLHRTGRPAHLHPHLTTPPAGRRSRCPVRTSGPASEIAPDLRHRTASGLPAPGVTRRDGTPSIVSDHIRHPVLNHARKILRWSLESERRRAPRRTAGSSSRANMPCTRRAMRSPTSRAARASPPGPRRSGPARPDLPRGRVELVNPLLQDRREQVLWSFPA